MKLSNRVYDILKFLCTIFLPACGSLYFGLSSIWGFPYGEQIVGTLSLVACFIGTLIGISTKAYREENEWEK